MTTQEIIDKIFKDQSVKYDLTEFEGLGKHIHDMLNVFSEEGTGRLFGKKLYFIKPLAEFHSAKEKIQIYSEDGKSNPEEIVRQLWVYKLIHYYNYKPSQIECEIPVQFGVEVNTKFADIAVYRDDAKETVKLLFEIKKPKRKEGIEQLKTYLGAKGNPIGIWSNGSEKLILYKPHNTDFDTLSEVPKINEEAKDVLEIKRTLGQLKTSFNFKKIIQDLEELVLANSGVDEFNEIFKLIFAKIWDEKEANENRRTRPNKEILFKKFEDAEITYDTINGLFKKACAEWQGVFEDNENIKLKKDHLQVCIGPIEPVRLMGSNLRIMDDAFEYLLPTEAKKKKGQFFTPRHVIEMCVRMLNPQPDEYVLDPSCGSAGFLLHAMEWAMPANSTEELERRKHRYASKYLWGIDIESRAVKTARALMLIAGDGHTNIFGPDVSSLDPRDWYTNKSGKYLMSELSKTSLLRTRIPEGETFTDNEKAWDYFGDMNFDLVLANPPFAGEMKEKKMLVHYELAKPALKRAKDKAAKEERDVLFIERIIRMLRPGGRAAIVLPQGKFNNSSLAFIREWILRQARLLAVVGLHGNTFKPHTGTKTSVLLVQKYTDEQLAKIIKIQNEVAANCPDYENQISDLLTQFDNEIEIAEENIPEAIFDLLLEEYPEPEIEIEDDGATIDEDVESAEPLSLDEKLELIDERINELRANLLRAKNKLDGFSDEVEAIELTQKAELTIIKDNWTGSAKEYAEHIKPVKEAHKNALKVLKEHQKETTKSLKAEIKSYEYAIPSATEEKLLLTNKGKLELLAKNEDSIKKLRNRFIDAEVAKRLDYKIFMAVSEHGGKNNSGDYEYMIDEDGNIVEDDFGNPEIKQDLVNHRITKNMLVGTVTSPEYAVAAAPPNDYESKAHEPAIAEAFIEFAKEQEFNFWKN